MKAPVLRPKILSNICTLSLTWKWKRLWEISRISAILCKLQTCQPVKVQNLEPWFFSLKRPGDSGQNGEIFLINFSLKTQKHYQKVTSFLANSWSANIIRHRPSPAIYDFHWNQKYGDKKFSLEPLQKLISLMIIVFMLFVGVPECLIRYEESL